MILPTATDIDIQKEGELREYAMTIDAADQGIIFEFLRSKIYKRPIDAICREIMSNSRDANREVSKADVPIVVGIREGNTLVDNSSMAVYFKDEGPGISPERMGNVFCKYAASTKRDSNFQTGGFGLGAKTPFSYTDVFSVETVVDGIKYIYTAYIDETKRGMIQLQSKDAVVEPNGTTIVVPLLNKNDRDKFEHACRYYSMFWSIDPIFENFQTSKVDFGILHHDVVDGVTFSVIESVDGIFNRGNMLIIDGVPYEIDVDQIGYNSVSSKINNKYILALHFDNGMLDVSISREGLQYNEGTKTILKDAYDIVREHMKSWFVDYLETADHYFDANMMYYSLLNPSSTVAVEITQKYPTVGYMPFAYGWLKQMGDTFDLKYKGLQMYKSIDNTYVQVQVFKTASMNDQFTGRMQDVSINDLWKKTDIMYYLEPGKALTNKKTYSIFNSIKPQADGTLMFMLLRVKNYTSSRRHYYDTEQERENFKQKAELYFNTFIGDFAEFIQNYHDVTHIKNINIPVVRYAMDELTSIKVRTISSYSRSDDDSGIIYYSKERNKFYSSTVVRDDMITSDREIDVIYHAVNTFADYRVSTEIRQAARLIGQLQRVKCVLINEKSIRYFDGVETVTQRYDKLSANNKRFEGLRVAKKIIEMSYELGNSNYLDYDFNCYGHRDAVIKMKDKAEKIRNNKTIMNLIKNNFLDGIMEDWTMPVELRRVQAEIAGISKVYPIYNAMDSYGKIKHKKHINMYIQSVNTQRKYSDTNKLNII